MNLVELYSQKDIKELQDILKDQINHYMKKYKFTALGVSTWLKMPYLTVLEALRSKITDPDELLKWINFIRNKVLR
jgi:hypothetical protein